MKNNFAVTPTAPRPIRLSLDKVAMTEDSPLFLLEIDRRHYESLSDVTFSESSGGLALTGHVRPGVSVTWTSRNVGDNCWEFGLSITNADSQSLAITRMDPINLLLTHDAWRTHYYRSAWGDEFRPRFGSIDSDLRIDSRAGRSSNGHSPFLGVETSQKGLVISPAWSGNWHIDLLADRRLTAGISPWKFETELRPGTTISAPSVVVAIGDSIDDAAFHLTDAIRRNWIPISTWSDSFPLEWNHWWPYEDQEVTEAVITENAEFCKDLGFEVATVDAGWFGRADKSSDWQQERGDWDQVNSDRFPSGISALGDAVRSQGVEIGMWIEAEAIGAQSQVRRARPEILAIAPQKFRPDPGYRSMTVSIDPEDETFLGYVCLGSAAGRSFVLESMVRLVRKTGARWIKLDFNIDPDAGCVSATHQHGAQDGLFAHYNGLYTVLDEFRSECPEVLLESCSSGGLRFDLGIARHVHRNFLSDPDYTDHHLQVFWGASQMMPPAAILHWSWSQWRGDYPDSQLDFSTLSDTRFSMMLASAMIHSYGVSLRLPELSDQHRKLLAQSAQIFRSVLVDYVREGSVRRLTGQILRRGGGERNPAFQLTIADSGRHLIAGFRVDESNSWTIVRPKKLSSGTPYQVNFHWSSGESYEAIGAELMRDGIVIPKDLSAQFFFATLEPKSE